MKKMPDTLDNIKQKILKLKGEEVKFYINRGRRKTTSFRARIDNVYMSVFTVKTFLPESENTVTYSYNDVLCGDVKISKE